jgi:hypothetical protein
VLVKVLFLITVKRSAHLSQQLSEHIQAAREGMRPVDSNPASQ